MVEVKTFSEHVKSFFRFDAIRVTRLFEIIQYAFLFSAFAIVTGKVIDRFFENFYQKDEIKTTSEYYKTGLVLCAQVVVSALTVFYMRKLLDIVPIVINLAPSKYIPHWKNNEATGEISLAIAFIGIQQAAVKQLERMRDFW